MDPSMMMLLATLAGGALSGLGGKNEKQGSTYSKGQLGGIDNILNMLKGQNGNMDVTQNQNYQNGQDWLQSMFSDPDFFNKFEAPLQRQYQEQTIPDLANRFGSMGSGGALGSTAFRNQAMREGSNLSSNIAALRGGMQQQGVNQSAQYAQQPFSNILALYNQALQPTQNTYQGATPGFAGNIFSGLTSGLSQGYGNQMGMNMANANNRFPGQNPSTV